VKKEKTSQLKYGSATKADVYIKCSLAGNCGLHNFIACQICVHRDLYPRNLVSMKFYLEKIIKKKW